MNSSEPSASAGRTAPDPCDAVLLTLRRGESLSQEQESHAASCPTCTELQAGGSALRPPTLKGLSDAEAEQLLARAREAVKGERGFWGELRSQRTSLRVGIALTALAILALVVGGLSARPDLVSYPPGRLLLSIACLVVSFLAATTFALRPEFRQPSRFETVGLVLAVGTPIALALLPEVETGLSVSAAGSSGSLLPHALGCFVAGSIIALPVLLVIASLSRVKWQKKAILGAAAAGVGGVLGLELHCPTTGTLHLLLGHSTVVLALIAAVAASWSLRRTT